MKPLRELQRNWEGLAQADPFWAICTAPEKDGNRWTQEEFFATGEKEISTVLDFLSSIGIVPDLQASALDFGCGVGRLTRALAKYFHECSGIDISPTMIQRAREFTQDSRCRFLLNEQETLAMFPDDQFGFIYSSIVLQHIARRYSAGYIRELVRVLKPGGVLVFQLPDRLRAGLVTHLRMKLALGSRARRLWQPRVEDQMEMHCLKEMMVRKLIEICGASVVDVRLTNSAEPAFCGDLRFLTEEPERGYVSKQYCVVKDGQAG